MKKMIRLAALVTILCALPAAQLTAQVHHEPPGVNSFGWLIGIGTSVNPAGQPVLVAVFTTGTVSFPAGTTTRGQLNRSIGGYLVSILVKAGIISFRNGRLVINEDEEDPAEPTPLEVVGSGG